MSHKPQGYNAVAPYLLVADAEAEVDFLKRAFDAEVLHVIRGEQGRLRHVAVRIDDSVVMMGEMPGGGPPVHVHLYLEDPDAALERAVAAGATVFEPVALQDYGERRGAVSDPNGVTWWISRVEG